MSVEYCNRCKMFHPDAHVCEKEILQGCGDCDPCIGGRPDQCAVGAVKLNTGEPEECAHGNSPLDRPKTCDCFMENESQITTGGLVKPTPPRLPCNICNTFHSDGSTCGVESLRKQLEALRVECGCWTQFGQAVAKELGCLVSYADPRPEHGNAHMLKAIKALKNERDILFRNNKEAALKMLELTTHPWIRVKDSLPEPGQRVFARYEGVYESRPVTFWQNNGFPHFGLPDEPDGQGIQPATHWRDAESFLKRCHKIIDDQREKDFNAAAE